MDLKNIFKMTKTNRYTQDGRDQIAKLQETEDVRYKTGDISQKTGLQKQPDGSWAPPKKGSKPAAKKEAGSINRTPERIAKETAIMEALNLSTGEDNNLHKMSDETIERLYARTQEKPAAGKTTIRQGPNTKTLNETPAEHIQKNLDAYKGNQPGDMEGLVLGPSGYKRQTSARIPSGGQSITYTKEGEEDITLFFDKDGELENADVSAGSKPATSKPDTKEQTKALMEKYKDLPGAQKKDALYAATFEGSPIGMTQNQMERQGWDLVQADDDVNVYAKPDGSKVTMKHDGKTITSSEYEAPGSKPDAAEARDKIGEEIKGNLEAAKYYFDKANSFSPTDPSYKTYMFKAKEYNDLAKHQANNEGFEFEEMHNSGITQAVEKYASENKTSKDLYKDLLKRGNDLWKEGKKPDEYRTDSLYKTMLEEYEKKQREERGTGDSAPRQLTGDCKIKIRQTQDVKYKTGDISQKTGLQKQPDGSWAPPKNQGRTFQFEVGENGQAKPGTGKEVKTYRTKKEAQEALNKQTAAESKKGQTLNTFRTGNRDYKWDVTIKGGENSLANEFFEQHGARFNYHGKDVNLDDYVKPIDNNSFELKVFNAGNQSQGYYGKLAGKGNNTDIRYIVTKTPNGWNIQEKERRYYGLPERQQEYKLDNNKYIKNTPKDSAPRILTGDTKIRIRK